MNPQTRLATAAPAGASGYIMLGLLGAAIAVLLLFFCTRSSKTSYSY